MAYCTFFGLLNADEHGVQYAFTACDVALEDPSSRLG